MFSFSIRNRQYISLLFALALSTSTAAADDDESDLTYMTLNGLQSLVVEVDGMQRDFARFGLTADTILASTIAELRNNGINVVERSAIREDPGTALMRIKINANENQYRFYFYGISIELKQKIPLNNPAGGYIAGTIWKEGRTGIVMPTELRNINGVVADLLAEFVKDFRSQNPPAVAPTAG